MKRARLAKSFILAIRCSRVLISACLSPPEEPVSLPPTTRVSLKVFAGGFFSQGRLYSKTMVPLPAAIVSKVAVEMPGAPIN